MALKLLRWVAGFIALAAVPAIAQHNTFVLASTTSTEQSGLFGHLLPRFRQATGIAVRVIAVGSGQALDIARRGDADAVLVHDPDAEARFVAEGFALERRPVMVNDFVLVGPVADPARVRGRDIAFGLARIAAGDHVFISRADHSGTHAMELRLWTQAGVGLAARKPRGYRECGCGMGPALNIASALNGYALTDRGTWLGFRNRGALAILVEGDRRLLNPYSVMVVNPARHRHVKHENAKAFADWIVSAAGQAAIAEFKIGGEQAFFPGASR